MIVRDMALFYTRDPARMFPEEELIESARAVGEQVLKIAAAPLGDNYTGPVLFEGVASPQLMAEVLGRNLHISRKPVTRSGRRRSGRYHRSGRPPRRAHHAGNFRRDRRSDAAAVRPRRGG